MSSCPPMGPGGSRPGLINHSGQLRSRTSGVHRLSITHKLRPNDEAEFNVGQPRQAAPHDRVAWWRILGAGKIATQPGHFGEVGGKGGCPAALAFVLDELVE